MQITVARELKEDGIKVVAAIFEAGKIVNRVAGLEKKKEDSIPIIANFDTNNPILKEYRRLHEKYGGLNFPGPSEAIIGLVKKNKRLPNINCVVDSYNLVSAFTFLSIGAHDLCKIKGNLRFEVCSGKELYIPLGSNEEQAVKDGEYACLDDEKVICWLDIKQCDQTKITKDTKKYLIYIQGNHETSKAYLDEALAKVISFQQNFCEDELVKKIGVHL